MNNKNSITSEIDLNQLTLPELMTLKDRVDEKLAEYLHLLHPIAPEDVYVEFSIKASTNKEVIAEAKGDFTLASVLNEAVSPMGPQVLDENVHNRIFTPINGALNRLLLPSSS